MVHVYYILLTEYYAKWNVIVEYKVLSPTIHQLDVFSSHKNIIYDCDYNL